LKERMTVMPADQIEVVRGELGDEAGMIGMAVWAAKGGRLSNQ